jgi:acyl-lipid (7-3)-desaturase (Delta-4 desaturase)
MPPNADKVRHRTTATTTKVSMSTTSTLSDAVVGVDQNDTKLKCIPLSQLGDMEMCIDGIIYDITEFQYVHPGGSSFVIFGGNDVTTQYYMIHPYHTNKHLLKLKKVGIVSDYKTEYVFLFVLYVCVMIVCCVFICI